jgi:hypothetical protein
MLRRGIGGLLMLLVVLTMLVLGANTKPSRSGRIFAIAEGAAFAFVTASALEWLVHRHLYHRAHARWLRPVYLVHHRGHHADHFPTWRYVAGGKPRRFNLFKIQGQVPVTVQDPLLSSAVGSVHVLAYAVIGLISMVMPGWILTQSLWFTGAVIAVLMVVSPLFVVVHDAMHFQGLHPWIVRRSWFEWLNHHHFIHHVDTDSNVNFLLPLGDMVLGTLRTRLREQELTRHGSFEAAKGVPVGNDELARIAVVRVGRHPGLRPPQDAVCPAVAAPNQLIAGDILEAGAASHASGPISTI